jgi:oligopeptide/dipeptide ABC transporter ATP-binding protein
MSMLLEARDVNKTFTSRTFLGASKKVTVALDDASIAIRTEPATVISIAGESGSGKTTLSRLLLGLIGPTEGAIYHRGKALGHMSKSEWLAYRREVQAIFQDPFDVYNPFYKIDHALYTPIQCFEPKISKAQALAMIEKGLSAVGLRPEETLGRYPHQLSGGQRQRVMVARALLLEPSIIVADEPVSMVDASLRATILESLLQAHHTMGVSLIYITHDLTTAYQVSQSILMLYQGMMVEVGNVDKVIKDPLHPYTQLLVSSIPLPDPKKRWSSSKSVEAVAQPPSGKNMGCKFAPRCPYVMQMCWQSPPPLYKRDPDRAVACFLHRDAPVLEKEEVMQLYTNATPNVTPALSTTGSNGASSGEVRRNGSVE